jgi:signal transduction histidine kinase
MDISPAVTVRPGWLGAVANGFRASWLTILLIVAINTGVAAILSLDDARPFWHPFISAQSFGLSIAYAVNAASPGRSRADLAAVAAVAIAATGSVSAQGLRAEESYRLELVSVGQFLDASGLLTAFRQPVLPAQVPRGAEAHRMLEAGGPSGAALESELKLMQAQVEPHFLFNTLASVQYLTETDPPQASKLLGHLLAYLRAALPQLRSASATLGQELELVEAYLNILRMRMGPRLSFTIDIPAVLRAHAVPPGLLISIVENAVTHGLEPQAQGGSVRVEAQRDGDRLVVAVTDTGVGPRGRRPAGPWRGTRERAERIAALFGSKALHASESPPRGARGDRIPLAAG